MKFLILMYAPEGAWPPEDHQVALAESVALCRELQERRQFVGAAPLQPAHVPTLVRVREGTTNVMDGPFVETKEHLGGYFVVDVKSLDEAIAIAERLPGSRRGTAEIRPLMEVAVPSYLPE